MLIKINKQWVSGNLRQRQIKKARRWIKLHRRYLRKAGKYQELREFVNPWARGWEYYPLEK